MADVRKEEEIPDREIALIHELSKLEHEQWCAWAKEIDKTEKLSTGRRKRWKRLLTTPFEMLTGAEQYQDKRWANEVLEILWRMGIETMTVSPKKQQRVFNLSDIELAWLNSLTPGFGNDANEVLRYIMRSWIGDRMGLDWMKEKATKKR